MKTMKSSSGGCGCQPTPSDAVPAAAAHITVSELKSTLLAAAAEIEQLKRATSGSLADALADWVAAEDLNPVFPFTPLDHGTCGSFALA